MTATLHLAHGQGTAARMMEGVDAEVGLDASVGRVAQRPDLDSIAGRSGGGKKQDRKIIFLFFFISINSVCHNFL